MSTQTQLTLEELIKNSATIQTMTEEEKKDFHDSLAVMTDEEKQELYQTLLEEHQEIEKIKAQDRQAVLDEFNTESQKIVADAKHQAHEKQLAEEQKEREEKEKEILAQLDDI